LYLFAVLENENFSLAASTDPHILRLSSPLPGSFWAFLLEKKKSHKAQSFQQSGPADTVGVHLRAPGASDIISSSPTAQHCADTCSPYGLRKGAGKAMKVTAV